MTTIKWLLFIALLLLSPIICSAQDLKANRDFGSGLQWFEQDANNHQRGLLFKAIWYVVPYPKHYYALVLYKDGRASTYRMVPNWAVQDSQGGVLSLEQVSVVKEMLSNLDVQLADQTELKEGAKRTAVVYLEGEKYKRNDFVGDLPVGIQRIFDLIDEEIKTQDGLDFKIKKSNPWLE